MAQSEQDSSASSVTARFTPALLAALIGSAEAKWQNHWQGTPRRSAACHRFDPRRAREQFLHSHPHLHAGQGSTRADVDSCAIQQICGRIAAQPKRFRVLENATVPIGRKYHSWSCRPYRFKTTQTWRNTDTFVELPPLDWLHAGEPIGGKTVSTFSVKKSKCLETWCMTEIALMVMAPIRCRSRSPLPGVVLTPDRAADQVLAA